MELSELQSIIRNFKEVEDPRRDHGKKHKLVDILVISILASISRCDDWVEIASFGRSKANWLATFLELPNGVPSHDTFRRVFSLVNPKSLQKSITNWLQSISEFSEGEVIAIDGKTLKRSFDKSNNKSALHVVNAWATERGIVLGQTAVDTKSNEIVAIPELLDELVIKDSVITIDAMGCQKAIADKIRENGADYVLGLKANHPTLLSDTKKLFAKVQENQPEEFNKLLFETVENNHGRIETRHCVALSSDNIVQAQQWNGMRSVVMVERVRETGEKVSTKKHYYISSLPPDSQLLENKIRAHWKVENTLHWSLDVTFNEDQSRLRDRTGAQNLSLIRKTALSLIKNEPTPNISIKRKRLMAGWDNELLIRILTGKCYSNIPQL